MQVTPLGQRLELTEAAIEHLEKQGYVMTLHNFVLIKAADAYKIGIFKVKKHAEDVVVWVG